MPTTQPCIIDEEETEANSVPNSSEEINEVIDISTPLSSSGESRTQYLNINQISDRKETKPIESKDVIVIDMVTPTEAAPISESVYTPKSGQFSFLKKLKTPEVIPKQDSPNDGLIPEQTMPTSSSIPTSTSGQQLHASQMLNMLSEKASVIDVEESVTPRLTSSTQQQVSNDEEDSSISIEFKNVPIKLIEQIQTLLNEEYIERHQSKKSRRKKQVPLCSGSIGANPLFVTEKINMDSKYVKVEIEKEEPKPPKTSNKTCFNCMEVGHIMSECPHSLDEYEIQRNIRAQPKDDNNRFFVSLNPKHNYGRSSRKNSSMDIKNLATRLSEKTRKNTSSEELKSFKGQTPQNSVHTQDKGKVGYRDVLNNTTNRFQMNFCLVEHQWPISTLKEKTNSTKFSKS